MRNSEARLGMLWILLRMTVVAFREGLGLP